MNKNPLPVIARVAIILAHAVANQSKKIVSKILANPRVRLSCMAYARHAESIMLSSIIFAVIALVAYLLLVARNSSMSDMEIIVKSTAVFAGFVMPAVPAVIILDKLEMYKMQLKHSQEVAEAK